MNAKVRYTLSVWIERPIRDVEDAEWMPSAAAQRELEREVLRALRKVDGDCGDCEVVETPVIEDEDGPENIADTGVDTWEEYRGER